MCFRPGWLILVLFLVLGFNAFSFDLRFLDVPPREAEIASPIKIRWESGQAGVQFRYKLDMPGDWMGGIQYALKKWSAWGETQSVYYDDFILEGPYTFTVEAKDARGNVQSISTDFQLHFVMPELLDDGIRIDWQKVSRAATPRERFLVLAEEYHQSYLTWSRLYDDERRVLKQSASPDEITLQFSKVIVTKSAKELLKWADAGVAASLSKVLAPKTLYDIIKQLGLDIILVIRNVRTNRAAFSMVTSYWAWKGYEALAADLPDSSAAGSSSSNNSDCTITMEDITREAMGANVNWKFTLVLTNHSGSDITFNTMEGRFDQAIPDVTGGSAKIHIVVPANSVYRQEKCNAMAGPIIAPSYSMTMIFTGTNPAGKTITASVPLEVSTLAIRIRR